MDNFQKVVFEFGIKSITKVKMNVHLRIVEMRFSTYVAVRPVYRQAVQYSTVSSMYAE